MIRARAVGNAVFLETPGNCGDVASWGEPSEDSAKWKAAVINSALRHNADAFERLAFTHEWYAVRWERLRKLIHDDARHIEDEACAVMANGTAHPFDPPDYARQLNAMRAENESLRKDRDEWRQAAQDGLVVIRRLGGEPEAPCDS
jgi:hypothetical protein